MNRYPRTRLALAAALLALSVASPAAAQDNTPEIADGKVESSLDRKTDRAVEERLRATYKTIDSLAAVTVKVEAGVVRLSGTVDSSRARELAGELARQVAGVTAVENRVQESRSVRRRLDIAVDKLEARGLALVEGLPLLIVAILVIALSLLAARVLTAWERPYRWLAPNAFLRNLLQQAVRTVVAVGGVLMGLEILDATALVGAVLGAAGVAGLAIGFAFRDLVENYIASILLSLRQPFAPNDHVRIEGHEGKVARLTSRATVLVTFDGNHIRIPNGVVFKAVIENFTRKPERRFSFSVGVGTEQDLAVAQDLGVSVLSEMEGVLDDPKPFALVHELGDSNVTVKFYGWVDQRRSDYSKIRSEAIRLVKNAFDREGIEMPEPIHRIRMDAQTPAEKKQAAPKPAVSEEQRDTSPDTHIEEALSEERAEGEEDLLSEKTTAE